MTNLSSVLRLLSFVILATGFAQAATDYEIRLDRVAVVGERYRVVANGTDDQAMTASAEGQAMPPRNERFTIELTADCEVLAVSGAGRETRLQLVIVKFARTDKSHAGELLAPGVTVVAERKDSKTNFMVGNEPVNRLVNKAFEIVGISLRNEDKVSDDKVFGTTERKKVGDSWPINSAAAAADLATTGVKVDPSNLTGTATLVEATQANGQPVLRIEATMTMEGVTMPLPPGVEIKKSVFKARFSGLFPVDPTQRRAQEGMSMEIEIAAAGAQNGRTMELAMTKKTTRDTKFTR